MIALSDFLLARIAEDEADPWRGAEMAGADRVVGQAEHDALREEERVWEARVLAECEAKRRLLTFVLEHGETVDAEYGCCHDAEALQAGGSRPDFDGDEFSPLPDDCPGAKAAAPGLHILALPYADHEDFREEWKP